MSGTKRSGRRSTGYFGVAVYQPKSQTNVGTLWRSAFLQGAAFIATIGKRYIKQPSDTCGAASHVPLQHWADFDDFHQHLPHGCPIVGVELTDQAKPLPEFAHPQQCVYLLGAEDHGLPPWVMNRCHRLVTVPTVRDWSMNVAVAGSIIMYDRHSKTRLLTPLDRVRC